MTRENEPLQQAISWSLTLEEQPDDDAVAAGFMAWFTATEENRKAWAALERTRAMAQAIPAMAQAIPNEAPVWGQRHDAIEEPLATRPLATKAPQHPRRRPQAAFSKPDQRRRSFTMPWLPVSAGLAACLLIWFNASDLYVQLFADHATSAGEMRTVVLSDGSTVHIGARSALSVEMTAKSRDVTLISGDAFFDVQRDTERPFTINVDSLRVRVVGTAFEVRRTSEGGAVAVSEGVVQVGSHKGGAPGIRIEAGEFLRKSEGGGADRSDQLKQGHIDPGKVAAWRRGRLIVEDWPLSDVVGALARHFQGRVIYSSWLMKGRRVTGAYDLDDPIAALRLIGATQGWRIRRVSPWMVIVSPV